MKILLLFLLVSFLSWDAIWWLAGVRSLLPGRLKKMLRSQGQVPVLIDVRTATEYRWFHIEQSENCPALLARPETCANRDHHKPVVVVCMSGHRSAVAAYRLRQRGFDNVSYLTWGMLAWALSGGPITRSNTQQPER